MTKHLLKIYQLLLYEYGLRNKWFGETADEIIIGAILTQNTNWLNVEKALANLRADHLLLLPSISKMQPDKLAEYIRPAGYPNQKAARLISIALALTNDALPQEPFEFRKYLLALNGIDRQSRQAAAPVGGVHARRALQQTRVQVEDVAGEGLASGRAAQQQR